MNQAGKTLSEMMRAAEYDRYGVPGVLQVPRPQVEPGQALVRVHASSVNPIDTIVRSGALSFRTGKKFPKRSGIDFAGEVVEIASDVSDFKIGDRVWGVMPLTIERGFGQGSAADFVTIETSRLTASPKNLPSTEAASISSVGAVAIITLRDKAKLQPGERLLIRGAAGGVGCMAVQLGKALGAHVTVLASARDLEFLQDLGATEALDYRTTTPSSLKPFDVILDLVGTDLGTYRHLLSDHGRMFCLAQNARSLAYIMVSKIFGSKQVQTFNATPMEDTMSDLTAYVDDGSIRPVIHSIYDLDNITAAHFSLEKEGGRGKRVVKHTDI
jgi:NADPH:quinone reductase-like Zn-dependent oxidoreductase